MLWSHHLYARLEQQTWAQAQEQTGCCCCSEPASCSPVCKRAVLRAQPSPTPSPACPSHGFPLSPQSHPSALSVSHHCGSSAFCAEIFLAVSAWAEIPYAPQESFWLVTLLLPRLCFGFHSEGHCGPLSAGGLLCPVSCNAVYRAVFPPSLQFRSGSSGCFGPNCQCQAENYGEEISGTQHLSFVTHPFGETPARKD